MTPIPKTPALPARDLLDLPDLPTLPAPPDTPAAAARPANAAAVPDGKAPDLDAQQWLATLGASLEGLEAFGQPGEARAAALSTPADQR